jgi:hypothetical protein
MWGAVGATVAVLGLMGAAAALRARGAKAIPETAGVLA